MNSKKNAHKGLYIKNFGCQMNVYDGDRMQEMMSPYDYGSVNSVEDADLVILNTCHIREKATEKIYSELGRIKKSLASKEKKTTIAVAGCVAQAEGKELVKRAPIIDLVFGPLTYHHLPEILKSFENDKLLPQDVLWRNKCAFSDGVSKKNKSWHTIIKSYLDNVVSDEEFSKEKENFSHCKPISKESYYYRKVYTKYFGIHDKMIPHYWMPKWSDVNDPSARELNEYQED